MEFVYRGLTATLQKHIVTDEEVDRHIEKLQRSNQRIAVIKDRPTRLGDEVVLDYAGFCGDEQFAGGTAEMQTLVLGSGMFIPGFEEQLVDKVPEEKVTVLVTFPTSYHAEELAGKQARFECVIHEIRVKTPYELDDVFAQEVGGCYTFEEMRQQMKKSLQEYTDERGEMDLQDRLLRQAAQTLEFTVTDQALQDAVDYQMRNLEAQLSRQGVTLEMYCQFMQTTPEALRLDAEPSAREALRCEAAIAQIVELEKLEASQEEVAQALAVIARQNDMTLEQLKPHYNAEFEQAVIKSVLTSKALRLVRDAATVEIV